MDLTYTQNGDYLFPDLYLEDAELPIGKYGLLRKSYLKEHKRGWYSSLLLTGKLGAHLAEIDRTCTERVELIMNQLAQREGVTEALKAADQMTWVARMNNIRASAEEIVLSELVYC
ncbi:MAG: TnpV protein [Oscillospiraceae bacterium]|nr:TnpV protein [Oscillospiraceae bacterium]